MKHLHLSLWFTVALAACGRDTTDADVKMVGVGSDPEEIGPSPTPYGGVVGYDNVELAGGGLALAHMGLGSFDEVGPGFAQFAPPYRAIVGFSYLFDQKLAAADNLTFTAPVPPVNEDTCYTVFAPEGPIGSFNTVDVGDAMEFVSADGTKRFRMGRQPVDIPPDAQDLFVYYSSVEPWVKSPRTHKVPGADASDPRAMVEQVYLPVNYPYGEEMTYRFPGGVTRFDHPISSIPRPSTPASITLPSDLGGVLVSWDGPRYDADGEQIAAGSQSTCLEFYGEGRSSAPGTPTDCLTEPTYPTARAEWDSFPGQIYTAPWDADGGKIKLQWTPGAAGEQVTFAVRFMAEVDQNAPDYKYAAIGDRPATTCEEADAEWVTNTATFASPAMKGDPFSKMVEVSCLFADDGEQVVDAALFADALAYARSHDVGGTIFFFGRGSEAEVEVPAAKDPYDQRHDISPIAVSSRVVKIGRFHWDDSAAAGGEE